MLGWLLQGWTDAIVEEALKRLAELARPFKYVVTVGHIPVNNTSLYLSSDSMVNEI